MAALHAGRRLHLAHWCIGAGALRNAVWDYLHGHTTPSQLNDIDFAWFDANDLRPERDTGLQAMLEAFAPGLPWEVTNQAAVHLWFERYFGHAVAPLHSLEEAVATWPETATAVAVRLHDDDSLQVFAPHGLQDLLDMVVRRNPVRVSEETYLQRVAEKRYTERWPRVQVIESDQRAVKASVTKSLCQRPSD